MTTPKPRGRPPGRNPDAPTASERRAATRARRGDVTLALPRATADRLDALATARGLRSRLAVVEQMLEDVGVGVG